ncbi:MAG: LysM domain-containing protein [Patescibacteria group bacterium]|nr:MAG: LysM domain-containing protein [Patescibacteria group bacterium]
MFNRLLFILSTLFWALAMPALAQDISPLNVRAVRQAPDGVDRVLTFTIANDRPQAVMASGRVVVISVYGTSLPASLPIEDVVVPPGSTVDVRVRWHDAPIVGQLRATIILNEGSASATISSHAFWLLPNPAVAGGAAAALVAGLAIVHVLMRPRDVKLAKVFAKATGKDPAQPAPAKKAVPKPLPKLKPLSRSLAYRVEPGDSVMTLSSRFEVSWQEIVRVNRLKPPYTLRPGKKLQIPRHALKPKASPPPPLPPPQG